MDITIHASSLPHHDPDASLAFYRDTLGFEVRNEAEGGAMRWITFGPAEQPGTSIVVEPPAADWSDASAARRVAGAQRLHGPKRRRTSRTVRLVRSSQATPTETALGGPN